MDIYAIRKANLLALMKGRTRTSCAERWDTSGSTLSQITSQNAVRNLGDRLARKIERYEGLSTGWLDTIHQDEKSTPGVYRISYQSGRRDEIVMEPTEVVEYHPSAADDEVDVPVFREVEFAAGDGRAQVLERSGKTMRFSIARLQRAGVQPQNAACATARGGSMEPVIQDGSPIGIDTGCTHIIDGKIYALEHGDMLRIKRLYRMPLGRVRMVSENSTEYGEESYSINAPEAPRIIGRVFWWENFD